MEAISYSYVEHWLQQLNLRRFYVTLPRQFLGVTVLLPYIHLARFNRFLCYCRIEPTLVAQIYISVRPIREKS